MPSAELAPPPADALHRKFGRILRHPDVDHPLMAVNIIGAVGNSRSLSEARKVMHVHLRRLPFVPPFSPGILEIPHAFLLLGVHRDHRFTAPQELLAVSLR